MNYKNLGNGKEDADMTIRQTCTGKMTGGYPLLSVVMPVYNPNKYLIPCLDSVLGQTFADFEVIAIDDCSSDRSYEVLKEYADKDARILPLRNDINMGAAKTRNRGLYLTRGKYIVFLDADDYFDKEYFTEMVNALEEKKADLAFCPLYQRDERTGIEECVCTAPKSIREFVTNGFRPRELGDAVFTFAAVIPFNKIIRREYLLQNNIEFQNISNCNDLYFGFISIAAAEKAVYLPTPYVHYRYNTGMQISTKRFRTPMNVCYAYKKLNEELHKRKLWKIYRRAYYEALSRSLIHVLLNTVDPASLLEYLHADGAEELNLVDLRRGDFLSAQGYGRYQIFWYGGKAFYGGDGKLIASFFKMLFTGRGFAAYWIAGHYAKKMKSKLKKMS